MRSIRGKETDIVVENNIDKNKRMDIVELIRAYWIFWARVEERERDMKEIRNSITNETNQKNV